ncbi:hypothetical protein GIB67_013530 [Kingdonia uniflora]|uniref:Uncharacterized protein n=1 Tax=Kingdonia uniflora TaxID=39325 RepID=A0A7J7KUU1_9MAGN|nr:hypothetical protein GIB67_013530 [Kingdonia uniflora]
MLTTIVLKQLMIPSNPKFDDDEASYEINDVLPTINGPMHRDKKKKYVKKLEFMFNRMGKVESNSTFSVPTKGRKELLRVEKYLKKQLFAWNDRDDEVFKDLLMTQYLNGYYIKDFGGEEDGLDEEGSCVNDKIGSWMSVSQFGDWDQKENMPDYSLNFSKI